jgi:ribose transport system permease protein
MRYLATSFAIPGLPNAVICWAVIGAAAVFVLKRTIFGRAIYGIAIASGSPISRASTRGASSWPYSRSRAARRRSRACCSRATLRRPRSRWATPTPLPAIAAVVLGGTSIVGGRGGYLGAVAAVMLVTLLQSILSVMQIPEFGRQIVYGVVIVCMLLLCGRGPRTRA